MSPTRRQVIKAGVVTGAAATIGGPLLLSTGDSAKADILDPTTIPKYVAQLPVLPAMPPSRPGFDRDEYVIGTGRVTQQMLPSTYPATTVFGYGAIGRRGACHTPGYTLEARAGRPVQATWVNQFVDSAGHYQSPLVTVDPTLHWANPPGGIEGRDSMPTFTSTPPPYTGPVPIVAHLHGGHTYQESDGYPEAWYLPVARNIPRGYATVGSFYEQYKQEAFDRWRVVWAPGTATYVYPLDQAACTLWFHDHALGMTRTNVYPGLLGFVILRGGPNDLPPGVLPGPAPMPFDPPGKKYYEIMMVLGNKTFNADGSLYFPASRSDYGDTTGPWIPQTDVPPYWNPLFTGNTITVNSVVWPNLDVEPRRYRFRVLNGSNFEPFQIKIVSDPLSARSAAVLPLWVIGSDGGFLPAPVPAQALSINAAERYDIIIDFTGITPGTKLYLVNEESSNQPDTIGQVMQFTVVPLVSRDTSTPPDQLTLPAPAPIGTPTNVRQLSTVHLDSAQLGAGVIYKMSVGTLDANGTPNPLDWSAPITETPALNSTETWEIWNFGPQGHPIHLHLVQFRVLNRQPLGGGAIQPPPAWETGPKDTVMAIPGLITRFTARFDRAGRYVWHCHFIDHEDNDMMRPFQVG
ncbi:MAG: multicopper oxidase domain-containing protein [Nocardiopsaceae bacterium]|nr:multicopper oxidase domain-containing protein [Nocardiopsaceae bacterium]